MIASIGILWRIAWRNVNSLLISSKLSMIAYLRLVTIFCGMGTKLTLSLPLEDFVKETLSPLSPLWKTLTRVWDDFQRNII